MRTALAVMLLLVVGSANAATVVYNPDTGRGRGDVAGIAELDIGGTLYDVDFGSDTGYTTFGGTTRFWQTYTEARTALDAVSVYLSSIAAPFVDHDGTYEDAESTEKGNIFGVQVGDVDPSIPVAWYVVLCDVCFRWHQQFVWIGHIPEIEAEIGTDALTAWSVSSNVVPIPAAVWLFGSGLGLLGWMKRKRA